jgi:hypothetical protein
VGVSINNRKEEKRIQEATARNVQGERRNGDEVRRERERGSISQTTHHTPKLTQVEEQKK